VRSVRIVALFWLFAVAGSLEGQASPLFGRQVSVLLTLSGGVSLGSYEAGVNWGLLEVFKLTTRDSIRRAWNLPRYDLRAAAGASAGNINGFLTAIEWCRTRDATPPEQSLFWKIWVRTGFDQLFPLERYNQPDSTTALFSRRYFRRVLFDTIWAAMQTPPASSALDGCTVPVGVTITRLAPDTIPIARGINALTQRYATAIDVIRRGAALRFSAPSVELAHDRKLGAFIQLPDCNGTVDTSDVFSLTEASSAFPGAFAPVWLKHEARPGAGCDRASLDSALFSDGGLFDNNPIDLVAGIYDDAVWKQAGRADSNAIIVFIDPDKPRGRLKEVEQEQATKSPPPETGGIAALMELFAGAVPSARQYEIQAFGRLLARAPQVFVRDNIKITDRRFTLVGQQLGNFAAFLGKPFREYDFYVGIYDALAFFASQACLQGDSLCVRGRLHDLVETEALAIDSLPRSILRALYAHEYPSATPAPATGGPAPSPRAILLRGLMEANFKLADWAFDNSTCRSGDAIVTVLCHDGFRDMMRRFANDAVLQALERADASRASCLPPDWPTSSFVCEADADFDRFVRSPEPFMADKMALMLHQLWRVERRRQQDKMKEWTGLATLGEVTFQSGVAYRYRRGFELNTSTIPNSSGWAWLAAVFPNYLSINVGSQGLEFGFRPTIHISNSLALGVNFVPLHLIQGTTSYVDRYRWAVGPTFHIKEPDPVVSGLETGVEMFARWPRNPFGKDAGRVWSIPVTVYMLADKLRVSLRYIPSNHSAIDGGSDFAVNVGLADLSGLVYWIFRKS
jgi:predicted acylesterase/phospholipase RssA